MTEGRRIVSDTGPLISLEKLRQGYAFFRQLYDIQHGSRKGPWSELMKAPVANLNEDDLVSIAAYVASRKP